MKRYVLGVLAVLALLTGGALLRGWLVPAHRADLSPEAYGLRLRLPWSPSAEVTIYYPTPAGTAWVAVRRAVPAATPLAALQELAAGPARGSGLKAVPMAVTDVTITNGVAVLAVPAQGPTPDALALEAAARTLAPWDVKTVQVGSAAAAVPSAGASVFYLWRGQPVPTPADLPDGPDRPAAAVRRLLAGPPPAGVEAMPGGVRLLGVEVKGDTAKVLLDLAPDVTAELTAGRWQFATHAMAIVYTLTDQKGIKRVQFDLPNLPPEARRNCRTPLGVAMVRPDPEPARAAHR